MANYTAGGSETQTYEQGPKQEATADAVTVGKVFVSKNFAERGPTIASNGLNPDDCPVTGCGRKWSARAVIETRDGQRRVAVGCLHHLWLQVGARTQGFDHPDNRETADGRPI